MTTCRDTITAALQMARVVGLNRTPTSSEAAAGLSCLQSFYDSLVTGGGFGRLTDTYQTANYEAAEGERVTAPTAITVTFPDTVDDLDNGGDRAPRDLSIIETVLNGTRDVKIYDRTSWVSLLALDLDDDAPLASRGAMGLAASLACSGAFVAFFGVDPGPDVRRLAAQFMLNLTHKYGTTRETTPAEYM